MDAVSVSPLDTDKPRPRHCYGCYARGIPLWEITVGTKQAQRNTLILCTECRDEMELRIFEARERQVHDTKRHPEPSRSRDL